MKRKHLGMSLCLASTVVLGFFGAAFPEFPDRPIKVIVGWPAGGTSDLRTRALCDPAARILKQPIIVENMPGASGTKALAVLTNTTPDGYTLCSGTSTAITEKPHVMTVSYDALKGFTGIMLMGWSPYGVAVRKGAPWKTFKDFIEYARTNPGKIKYSTNGVNSTHHLFVERLQIAVPGLKMVHIPFDGETPAVTALLGGHVDAGFFSEGMKPFIDSGELRMLASMGVKRWDSYPAIATVQEMGYPVAAEGAQIIQAPPGLPASIRTKLQEGFREAMKDKTFIDSMKKYEMAIDYMSGPELDSFLSKKYEEIGQTLKKMVK